MKPSSTTQISVDHKKHLVKFDPEYRSLSALLDLTGANLKWFSAYEIDQSKNRFLAVKLRDLIIQGISFDEYYIENPPVYIGDEPALVVSKRRFIFMTA